MPIACDELRYYVIIFYRTTCKAKFTQYLNLYQKNRRLAGASCKSIYIGSRKSRGKFASTVLCLFGRMATCSGTRYSTWPGASLGPLWLNPLICLYTGVQVILGVTSGYIRSPLCPRYIVYIPPPPLPRGMTPTFWTRF